MVTITIDKRTKTILDLFTGKSYNEKLGNLTMEIIKSKIREYNELIANFESKYGMKFGEFRIK